MAPQPQQPAVLFAGENPLILLYQPGGDALIAVASLWHARFTEHGAGYSLLIWADPSATGLGELAPGGIYTDNLQLARWLWTTFNRRWDPLLNHGLEHATPQPARFTQNAADRRMHRISCSFGTRSIELLWQDAQDAIWTETFPYEYRVTAVIAPCAQASIIVDGQAAIGEVRPHDDVFASSAVLAFCETWMTRL